MAVTKSGADELLEAGGAEVGYEGVVGCGDAHRGRPLSKKDRQIRKQENYRPKARMDHYALMEVLYYALCGIPCGSLGELTEFLAMIIVMEGHEVFGPLQLR